MAMTMTTMDDKCGMPGLMAMCLRSSHTEGIALWDSMQPDYKR